MEAVEDEADQTATADIPKPAGSLPKGSNKPKSHSQQSDKGSPASTSAASAKRRCVSTACIACRRRKSKVGSPLWCCEATAAACFTWAHRRSYAIADWLLHLNSAMGTRRVALLVPRSTAQSASTTPTQTTAARASTRRTSTISKPAIPPCKPSYKPSSTTRTTRCPILSNR